MKTVYTTFEIAKLCVVDITTVINWIDSGKLLAYKTPGGHRRIHRDEFVRFLKAYHMPIPRGLNDGVYTILVVDADESICSLVGDVLKEHSSGADIYHAADGFAAGKLLAEKRPALVILDITLPGIDGFEVCRLIRSDRRLKHTKILAVTAFPSDESQNNALLTWADDCVSKPFTIAGFSRCIEHLLQQNEADKSVLM